MSPLAHRLGMTLASFGVLVHLLWVLLVGFGSAKSLTDWLYGLHFLVADKAMTEFSLGTAIGLLIVVAIAWYVAGYVFGLLWTKFGKK